MEIEYEHYFIGPDGEMHHSVTRVMGEPVATLVDRELLVQAMQSFYARLGCRLEHMVVRSIQLVEVPVPAPSKKPALSLVRCHEEAKTHATV